MCNKIHWEKKNKNNQKPKKKPLPLSKPQEIFPEKSTNEVVY